MSKREHGCIWCYHGSKYRYLDDIMSVIPDTLKKENIRVIDLFCGGGSITTHLPVAWDITGNDIEHRVIDFHQVLQKKVKCKCSSPEEVEKIVRDYCRGMVKDRTDQEGYNTLKQAYNISNARTPIELFALTMSSNSNMIRFNNNGGFNLQFGKRYYNDNSSKKMLNYLKRVEERDISWVSKDFSEFVTEEYDLWVIDCPYINTTATYSENGQWSEDNDRQLLELCDNLHKLGKKFIYFNQTFCQDKENKLVNQWKDNYNVKVLKDTTEGCNYQRKNTGLTREIMVYNF